MPKAIFFAAFPCHDDPKPVLRTAVFSGIRIPCLTVLTLVSVAAPAAMNDVFPADFASHKEGTTVTTFYWYDRQQQGTWAKGQRSGDLAGPTKALAARVSHFYRIADTKVSTVAALGAIDGNGSGRSVPASATRSRSGLSDLRLGASAWLIENPAERHYLALNLTTFWPTGRYENRELFNMGENRRSQALTLGWIRGLDPKWAVELIPEVAWYGRNPGYFPGNVRMDQSRTVSLTSYLRYRFSPAFEGYVGFQATEGGQTTLNGVSQNNPIHGRRGYLGGRWNLDGSNRIELRYDEDISLRTGLKTMRETVLRWTMVY